MKTREVLLYFSLLYKGDFAKIYQAIREKEKIDNDLYQKMSTQVRANYCTIIDEDFPENLRNISNPPLVLFYYGDFSLLKKVSLAVIGSRIATEYGSSRCKEIVQDIVSSADMVILSGLAKGIDGIAHKTAIEMKGHTIAVLGSGIDNCYPKENRQLYEQIKANHLLISEYPNMVNPSKENFPFRNRIIAGLSSGILVVEAYEKSGTLITVGYGLEMGKEIMCFPYLANQKSACNRLIKEGATLVETSKDILEELK